MRKRVFSEFTDDEYNLAFRSCACACGENWIDVVCSEELCIFSFSLCSFIRIVFVELVGDAFGLLFLSIQPLSPEKNSFLRLITV